MICPFCQYQDTKVMDSRLIPGGEQIKRRRSCPQCQERFTTFEIAELIMPKVVKRDGSRVMFEEKKIRSGVLRAIEKRSIAVDTYEHMIRSTVAHIRKTADSEINSQQIGKIVLKKLYNLDQVAYVRFASVYLSFQNITAFQELLETMEANNA
jgi:transcriptional repressor NrdR